MEPIPSRTRNNLTYCTTEGFCATPWTILSLPGGFLMVGLLNAFFNIGPFWFGIIAAMPALANALHILLIPTIAKFMEVRDLTLGQGWLNSGLWLSALVGIAFLPTDNPKIAGIFFACIFAMTSITGSLIAVGWMTWLSDFVPERIRGRYMARRNRFTNLATLGFMLLSLAILGISNASRGAYLLLIGIAILGRLISMLIQHKVISSESNGGPIASANWTQEIAALRAHRSLIQFVIFGMSAGFWGAFLGATGPLYALEVLGASPASFTGYSIAATVAGTACVRLWGELIDRHGCIPVILITGVAWRIGDVGLLLITPNSLGWMYLVWIWGGTMATGYVLASFNLLLRLIPSKSRTAGISLNLTLTSITAAVAPIVAGLIISSAEGLSIESTIIYRTCIGIGLLGSAASVAIIWKMQEPKANPQTNTIQGAMRTLRELTVNQGLTFLSNATFIVKRRSNKDS